MHLFLRIVDVILTSLLTANKNYPGHRRLDRQTYSEKSWILLQFLYDNFEACNSSKRVPQQQQEQLEYFPPIGELLLSWT